MIPISYIALSNAYDIAIMAVIIQVQKRHCRPSGWGVSDDSQTAYIPYEVFKTLG